MKKQILKLFLVISVFIRKRITKPTSRSIERFFGNSRQRGVFFIVIAALIVIFLDYLFFLRYVHADMFTFLVSIHGIFFDVIIFSLTALGIFGLLEKRRQIHHYHEQLEDYRFWVDREGVLRKESIIRRLADLNAPMPDLKGIILTAANLSGLRLQGIHLAGARLIGTNFANSNLDRAMFIEEAATGDEQKTATILPGAAICQNAVFYESSLKHARLDEIDFSGLNCEKADFAHSILKGGNLSDAHLRFAIFEECEMEGIDMRGADLYETNLSRANLKKSRFSQAKDKTWQDGHCAQLSHVKFDRANLREAILDNTDMSHSSCVESIFYKAKMKNVNLGWANLSNATLREADLDGADFKEAVLKGADLCKANLRSAKNLRFEQLKEVKTLYLAGLDDSLIDLISKNNLTHLLAEI